MKGTLSGQQDRYLVVTFPNAETKKSSCKVTHAVRDQIDFGLSTASLEAQRPWAVLGDNGCPILSQQDGFSSGTSNQAFNTFRQARL